MYKNIVLAASNSCGSKTNNHVIESGKDVETNVKHNTCSIVKSDYHDNFCVTSTLCENDNAKSTVEQNCIGKDCVIKQDLVTLQHSSSLQRPPGAPGFFQHIIKGACKDLGVHFKKRSLRHTLNPKAS